jgi:hypothetical protein
LLKQRHGIVAKMATRAAVDDDLVHGRIIPRFSTDSNHILLPEWAAIFQLQLLYQGPICWYLRSICAIVER